MEDVEDVEDEIYFEDELSGFSYKNNENKDLMNKEMKEEAKNEEKEEEEVKKIEMEQEIQKADD